jgi:glycogen debranching enzyme
VSDDDGPVSADFHIQASPQVAALPKLVLKHGESFVVCDRRGDFPAHFDGELGFYHAGTRYLRWLELRLDGASPLLLGAQIAPDNDRILVALTNAGVTAGDEGSALPPNTLHLDRHLTLDEGRFLQSVAVASFHDVPVEASLEIIFSADFRDVFEVRGTARAQRGQILAEEREPSRVCIRYRGVDGVVRTATLHFSPRPLMVAASRAVYAVSLRPGEVFHLEVAVLADASEAAPAPPRLGEAVARLRASPGRLRARATRVTTDNEGFDRLLARSVVDLDMLLTETPHGRVPYAGVPWYVAPFGRDSVITALQLLPYAPEVAAGTLRFLAHWQGRLDDPFREEQPGRILHEYRVGEMANCREIPFVPYYGSVDATPLFVLLLAEYVRWTGDLELARGLWPAVGAALGWMASCAARSGYLEYECHSPLGLSNQGWKDSFDSVMHADGTLATPPIALVEAQAYAYAAWRGAAEVGRALEDGQAPAWQARAEALREAFNRDFWLEPEGFYALALDGQGRPCAVASSNPGHALWTGLVTESRAGGVARRLVADDMFSGWGLRTLSARERRYNPMSYHNGSVWPHDTAIAVAGFRRYRLVEEALTVATALFEASRHFEHARMPELFCGFARHPDQGPISYPVACAPQAWAAGSPLQLLTALLGLEPDAWSERLTLQSPVLPPWLRYVEIHDLRLGGSSFDIGVSRGRDGASVELIARRGDAELVVRR